MFDGKALGDALVASIKGYVDARISALEKRLAVTEARKGLHFRGTWKNDIEYGRDDCATHAGQLWICRQQGTRSKPGGSDAWQLASKTDLPR